MFPRIRKRVHYSFNGWSFGTHGILIARQSTCSERDVINQFY